MCSAQGVIVPPTGPFEVEFGVGRWLSENLAWRELVDQPQLGSLALAAIERHLVQLDSSSLAAFERHWVQLDSSTLAVIEMLLVPSAVFDPHQIGIVVQIGYLVELVVVVQSPVVVVVVAAAGVRLFG